MSLPCAAGEAESVLAITAPETLRMLEAGGGSHPGFSLGRMIDPAGAAATSNDAMFALPSMRAVRPAIDADFDRYVAGRRTREPKLAAGIGPPNGLQLFDRALLYSDRSRFALAGIVNRMDRAYIDPDRCGEIRLIYRLQRGGESEAVVRLPMTLTVVLTAGKDADRGCAGIAQRWLATDVSASGPEQARRLTAPNGPLADLAPEQVDRIEINLQIAHVAKAPDRPFRTEYLLKQFRLDRATRVFVESKLENQIDRDALLASAALRREFKTWLLQPQRLADLDRGTILVPEKFLASAAIATTPAGFERSPLQPAYGLVAPAPGKPVFQTSDVVDALKTAASNGSAFENIRSPAGFERRLNDIACSGCHQTRGIGGFHLPGVASAGPGAVSGSPLFTGDQFRRRDIVTAIGEGRAPDFSRGFADRLQLRGSTALLGTSAYDGWGAHCYQLRAKPAANDASFRAWTCAEGLACKPTDRSRFGMCFVK